MNVLRNIWIVFKKELLSYFVSPVAYILLAIFAIVGGFFFWNSIAVYIMMGLQSQMRGEMFPMNINEQIIRPLLSNIAVIDLFLLPAVTMRLFAEEKRTGTIELLATSPLSDVEVIIGKWAAALALYGAMLIVLALNFLWLFKYGNPDWKPVLVGFLGLSLMAGALLAIGTFISTLTKNQIVAGVVTFGVFLLLWVMEWMSGYDTSTWTTVASYLSVPTHLEPFSKGLLSVKDAVFYLGLIFLGLFLTARSMESLRWRT